MTTERLICIIAGTFILVSLALAIPASPVFVSEWFLALTAFVGANLLQSGVTRWCLMEKILVALGVRQGGVHD
ncbi:YgaP family membrane protein [Propionivibrio limicola]|uniref:YgaP family membrane protein n=1 Tax=Propionivibrio limicola TaxID=167645 RepID=UPI001292386C|nr:DUF2892 domain-containing protein [Propionivibrio limicola]